jgi:hypothetical protein
MTDWEDNEWRNDKKPMGSAKIMGSGLVFCLFRFLNYTFLHE